MHCKRVQEFILTDYIDGQMNEGDKSLIDQHLGHCLACKAYLMDVKNQAVSPFVNATKEVPVGALWARIKQSIEEDQEELLQKSLQLGFSERLRMLVHIPRPAFAVATFLTMIFMIGSMGQLFLNKPTLKINGPQQVAYLSSLIDEPVAMNNNNDSPTLIEKYFL